ncbi:MAG: excinuclease ABC subunit UvrC [Deltaproteobacteria bacterium]
MFNIKEEIKKLPAKPGVYIMRDIYDNILYIGKAVVLKNRVRQYFRPAANLSPRISNMVSRVHRFEYIVTSSETEALILECNLIKEHKPKFNVLMKDDKNYPYIKVTIKDEFPKIFVTRKVIKDGAKYFGPYADSGSVKETVDLITKIFQLRRCNRDLPREIGKGRTCLNFHINQCLGPCQGYIDAGEYRKIIDEICDFLNGKHQRIIEKLEIQMKEASENMEFEKAAVLRDRINSAVGLLKKQFAEEPGDTDADIDIIGLARGIGDACVQIFFVRNGKLVGRENFMFKGIAGVEDEEIISSFLKQFYSLVIHVPGRILISSDIQEKEVIEKWLSEKRGSHIEIKIPQKGDKRNLLEIARRNAELELHRQGIGYEVSLTQLKEILKLEGGISRIEAFDISNLAGSAVVGAMVVLENGRMDKSQYKRFKIKTVKGQDDTACINEVVSRRLRRALNPNRNEMENKGFLKLPDVILIDGGINQLRAAIRAVKELGLDICCAGMVKDRKHKTRGIVTEAGEEIELKKNAQVMKLISEIQEEVHRFTVDYHRKLRARETISSVLDDIQEIGITRKKELLKHFGSVEKISEAAVDELLKVKAMNAKAAGIVYKYFHHE